MFHPCFRNTQVHGTRKPHQLSHHLPAWGKKKSLSKLEDAKENHSLLPLPAQEEQMLFLFFFLFRVNLASMKGAKLKSLETNAFSLPASLAMVIKAFS